MLERWELLQSRYAVDDPPWLRLRIDTCRLPNGEMIQSFYVYELSTWVNVVALTRQQEVLLVRQYRHGLGEVVLELPGGAAEPGEDLLAAAQRELLEETGYGGGKWLQTGQISADPATHANRMYCFLALGVEARRVQSLDATEELELARLPLEEAVRLAQHSQMMQAMHVTSLFYALSALGWVQPPGCLTSDEILDK